jgi:leader peptidase (prepilin peptidase) / N-methyltransferase
LDRLLECALFVVGLIFGSFLNVCISRIPRDESIVSPPSHCPRCGAGIRWFDNIPLLSWVLLRGRCRACGERISLRYPAVELLTGLLFLACYAVFGPTWLTLKFCIFSFLLLGLIFMDSETGLLPREFTYSGIVLGLALSLVAHTDYSGAAFLLRIFGANVRSALILSLMDAFLGALVGAGFFYVAWAVYYLVRKQHGLGFGDIALMGMSGAFLGLKLVVLVIVLAPISAIFYVVFLLLQGAFGSHPGQETNAKAAQPFLGREIPFGVFLGSCSMFVIFAGEVLWTWYLGFF